MTPERFEKIKRMLDQRQADLTVIMEEVHKSHNLSAIIRTCDAMGVAYAHSVIPKGGYRDFNNTAKGAGRWVEVSQHQTVDQCFDVLRQQGKRIVCAHFSDKAVDYREEDYTQPMAILFGQELFGVTPEAAEKADGHVIIPMMGMTASYNVSVSAAIILAEAQRQRHAKGMFSSVQLNDAEYQRLLFTFAYPKEAQELLEQGRPFPALDENGQICS